MQRGASIRKHLLPVLSIVALAVAVLSAAGIAGAAKEANIPVSNLAWTIGPSSGFSPKALSKSKYTPAAFTVAAKVRTTDGSQVPPLEELLIDAQNSAIDVTGFPICSGGQRDIRDPDAMERACRSAIVGTGSMTVSVKFPEQVAIPAKSPLLVFNGGVKGGTTTFYIHAYLTQPIATQIISTMKVRKAGSGIRAVVAVPKIANGAGSVTDFSLTIDKKFTYKGKKVSVFSAKCVGGRIQAHFTPTFHDRSDKQSATIIRRCTSKP